MCEEYIKLMTGHLENLHAEVRHRCIGSPTAVSLDDRKRHINGITLCGCSCGAVTCFEIAKYLEQEGQAILLRKMQEAMKTYGPVAAPFLKISYESLSIS
jgi:hypothetical protein